MPTTSAMIREPPLPLEAIDKIARIALEEDGRASGAPASEKSGPLEPGHDLTSEHAVPAGAHARGRLVAKERGRLAGIEVFARVLVLCDPLARVELAAADGEALEPGQVVARVTGRARSLLRAERPALNLLQHLCGVATLTARFVERCGGRARILDTRKTTPGLRHLEKHAVRCGGGENHRFGLFDEALVKNNHLDLARAPLAEVVARLRAALGAGARIGAEARDEDEALGGVRGGADLVLLDNMDPARMAALCPALRALARERGRPVEIEASGGVTLENVAEIAISGVDRISIGALTHSAPALDLSFYLEPVP